MIYVDHNLGTRYLKVKCTIFGGKIKVLYIYEYIPAEKSYGLSTTMIKYWKNKNEESDEFGLRRPIDQSENISATPVA